MDRIFGRNEGNESRDFTRGRGYGEDQQFYDDEFSDSSSEWNRNSDFPNRRPGPKLQAQRNRPSHQRATDPDRDLSTRQGGRQDDYQDNGNQKSENSIWNDPFNSERERGSHFGKGPKGWTRSDERIKDEVSEALYRDYHIDASDIEVEVQEGVVTLSGTVENRSAKRAAEECVEYLSGVLDVHNRLRIEGKEKKSNIRSRNDDQDKRALS